MKELSHDDHYRGYVQGFLFSEDLQHVLLLRRPENQTLRGVNGKIIYGGSHLSAMWKIFQDETGYDYRSWQYLKPVPLMDNLYCHVFYGVGDLKKCKPLYSVEVWKCSVKKIIDREWKPIKISTEVATWANETPTEGFEVHLRKGISKLVMECQLNLLNSRSKIK